MGICGFGASETTALTRHNELWVCGETLQFKDKWLSCRWKLRRLCVVL